MSPVSVSLALATAWKTSHLAGFTLQGMRKHTTQWGKEGVFRLVPRRIPSKAKIWAGGLGIQPLGMGIQPWGWESNSGDGNPTAWDDPPSNPPLKIVPGLRKRKQT